MKVVVLGTWFSQSGLARKCQESSSNLLVLEYANGYIVVGQRQAAAIAKKEKHGHE